MNTENTSHESPGFFKQFWPFEGIESTKVAFISAIFSAHIFAYSLIKPLKDTIFIRLVGTQSLPWAKLLMIAGLPIFMHIYSSVDSKKNKGMSVIIFSIMYGLFCILIAFALRHPVIGLPNSSIGPDRWLGWMIYGCLDFYSIAVVATFWAMTNAISTPSSAGKQYGVIVALSRTMGALSAGMGRLILPNFVDTTSVPFLLIICGCALFFAAYLVQKMFTTIPKQHLTGYSEAHSAPEEDVESEPQSAWRGLLKVLSNSYAFGMFWLLCSFELISVIINYRMQCLVASQVSNSVQGVGTFLLSYTFIFQVLGAFLALFGTTKLLKNWGVPFTIMVTPVIVFGLSLSLIFINDLTIITLLMIALRTLDYSLDVPAREILFIPTTHAIQYQARGWISSFGKTISKTSASLYNGISVLGGASTFLVAMTYAPLLISISWLVTAFSIGKRYKKAVTDNRLIGNDEYPVAHQKQVNRG